jgi:hypothetical protein
MTNDRMTNSVADLLFNLSSGICHLSFETSLRRVRQAFVTTVASSLLRFFSMKPEIKMQIS